jgi:apolipoprotein N-acyltransferase
MPLWLFVAGLLSGTQFSLHNHPWLLIAGYAFFYHALVSAKKSLKTSMMYAFMFGYGFFCYSHSWISHPLTAFGDVYASLQPFVFVGVPFILAGYFVLIGLANYLLQQDTPGRVIKLSLITLCMEYLRCEYAPAVPLGQLGAVWVANPYITQSAAIFGIYGLSLYTLFLSYSLGALKQSKKPLVFSVILTIAIFCMGSWRISTTTLSLNDAIIRIVPTNWKQTDKYQSLDSRAEHLKHLMSQSASTATPAPTLILWPETTIEFALLDTGNSYEFMYPEIKSYLLSALPKHTTLLAGVVLRTSKNEAYNSLFAINNAQDIFYIYKKRLLAPFGEFMPPFLKSITRALAIRALDDFNRGHNHQAQLILKDGLTLTPIICYEGSFTGQIIPPHQQTDLITISTNDAWFRYNGKEQQFISHVFRAIEEGVAIIRCANGGYSGYISPLGTYSVTRSDQPKDFHFHRPLPTTPYRWIINHLPYWIELILSLGFLFIWIDERLFRRKTISIFRKQKKDS